jgi:hypothetical protein
MLPVCLLINMKKGRTTLLEVATFINAAVWLNVYLLVWPYNMMVDNVKKEWFALGLLLIILGLALVSLRNTPAYQDNYLSKGSLDNYVYYRENLPPKLSVSGYFEAGQHFFFNFTKGRFWGVQYDINNFGLEPPNTEFAPNTTIPAYKTVDFVLYTPSGEAVWSVAYLVGGTDLFAVVYFNQSADFVPLAGGNLTFVNVGMEGTVERTGNYTVKAISVDPPVHKDLGETYEITGDPPTTMNLWNIETVETEPYFVSSVSAGAVLLATGVVSSFLAARRPKKRQARVRSEKTRP